MNGAPCVVCFLSIFICAGLGVFFGGIVILTTAAQRDPEKDFVMLSSESDRTYCIISSYSVYRRTSRDDNNNNGDECHDLYSYNFCMPSRRRLLQDDAAPIAGRQLAEDEDYFDCGTTYQSKEHEKHVCNNHCGACDHRDTDPQFAVGSEVECWAPAPGYSPGFPYECGNEPCYKIFNPKDETDGAMVGGTPLGASHPRSAGLCC